MTRQFVITTYLGTRGYEKQEAYKDATVPLTRNLLPQIEFFTIAIASV